jgi:hypothetical protein
VPLIWLWSEHAKEDQPQTFKSILQAKTHKITAVTF